MAGPTANLLAAWPWNGQPHWRTCLGNGLGIANSIGHLPGVANPIGHLLGEWPCNDQLHWGSACRMALEWPAPLENFLGEWPWNDHFHWASAWGVALQWQGSLGICAQSGLGVASSIGELVWGMALECPIPFGVCLGGGLEMTSCVGNLLAKWFWNCQPRCKNLLGEWPCNGRFHWASAWGTAPE